MSTNNNSGVHISGNSVVHGAVAGGPNASAHYTAPRDARPATDELLQLLRDLRGSVRRGDVAVADPAHVTDEIDVMTAALDDPDADPGRIRRAAGRIGAALTAAGLTVLADRLADLVTSAVA